MLDGAAPGRCSDSNRRRRHRPRLLAEAGGRLHVLDVAPELVEADRTMCGLFGRRCLPGAQHTAERRMGVGSQPMLRISRSCLVNLITRDRRTPRAPSWFRRHDRDQQRGLRDRVREQPTLRLARPRHPSVTRARP
jgi:hypothetical protein